MTCKAVKKSKHPRIKRIKEAAILLALWPVLVVLCAFGPDWSGVLGAGQD